MDAGIPPYTADELGFLDEETQVEIALYRMAGRTRGMICVWLNSGMKCDNYEERPIECRDFERGAADCRILRRQHGVDREI